jgi:hypothetical protein
MEPKNLDGALFAYMVKYYSGTDAQSVYFQSMSDPRNALSWHRYLVTLHPKDYFDEFANLVGGPAWFVYDKPRRTAKQLASGRRIRNGLLRLRGQAEFESRLLGSGGNQAPERRTDGKDI